MKSNRTSSFPADESKTSFEDKVTIAFCVSIVLMATGAHWIYTEKSAVWGVVMMALVTTQCVILALYRRDTKRKQIKKNEAAGP